MSAPRRWDGGLSCNWQAEALAFCQSTPNTDGHALARQLPRLGDPVPAEAPPPDLPGADVPGSRDLPERGAQDPRCRTPRHPGDLVDAGLVPGRHPGVVLAHARPPRLPRTYLPLPPGGV